MGDLNPPPTDVWNPPPIEAGDIDVCYNNHNMYFYVLFYVEKEDKETDDMIQEIIEDYYKKDLGFSVCRIVIDDVGVLDNDEYKYEIDPFYDSAVSREWFYYKD